MKILSKSSNNYFLSQNSRKKSIGDGFIKSKEAIKHGSKDSKATKVIDKDKKYFFFFIKRVEEIFNQLIHEGKIKLLENHTILVTDQFKESKY